MRNLDATRVHPADGRRWRRFPGPRGAPRGHLAWGFVLEAEKELERLEKS